MCGIIGYMGKTQPIKKILNGLKELEYRGYDSAGIAVLNNNKFNVYKATGKIVNLEKEINSAEFDTNTIGIGHTRWATHGKPTLNNTHPHNSLDTYIVHNGIIENYEELRLSLIKKGFDFYSETDTEIIVKLFTYEKEKEKNVFKAFQNTLNLLQGSYAILLIDKEQSESIYYAMKGSPLLLSISNKEKYFASSENALLNYTSDFHYFEDGDYGYITDKENKCFNLNIEKPIILKKCELKRHSVNKNGYDTYMEKEIVEQSDVIYNIVKKRINNNKVNFQELKDENIFKNIENIVICACGTSYHAGLAASYILEREAKIKTYVEISSEFRYKEPLLKKNTLFITISQSGETSDTLEALKLAKKSGLKTLAICNVDNSSIVRLSDYKILTNAGIEKSVASTKAFSSQVMTLWLLSYYFITENTGKLLTDEDVLLLNSISNSIKVKTNIHKYIKDISSKYLDGHGFFFIGRDIFYPLALEGALKLKEITYLHATGYPSGEMKHGPIALADEGLYTIALISKNMLFDKTKSNIEELHTRSSKITVISSEIVNTDYEHLTLEENKHYMSDFFEMIYILQLFSLEICNELGYDVDMPKNLAKSVTVE
jgi:glucosamine--fructose-6-phosphate aminotransferase (isomerizing)